MSRSLLPALHASAGHAQPPRAASTKVAIAAICIACAALVLWYATRPTHVPWFGTAAVDGAEAVSACTGINMRPERPGWRLVAVRAAVQRLTMAAPAIRQIPQQWHVIPACNCEWLRRDIPSPCAPYPMASSMGTKVCWALSGTPCPDNQLATSLLNTLSTRADTGLLKQSCKITVESMRFSENRRPCTDVMLRFITWRASVAGTLQRYCALYIWENITTGEVEFVPVGQSLVVETGIALRAAPAGFQRAHSVGDNTIQPRPDPTEGASSQPCCPDPLMYPDVNGPSIPCCGHQKSD